MEDAAAAAIGLDFFAAGTPQVDPGTTRYGHHLLVCFEVDSMTLDAAVARLLQRRVVASASPYVTSYLRLAPSLVNSPADVDAALAAVQSLTNA